MQTETKLLAVTDFGGETNYSLIEYIALADDDASTAWGEFYSRHVAFVFKRLKKAYSGVFDEMCLQDLATETFIRVRGGAHTFKPINGLSPEQQTYHARAWLGRIARNIVNSEIKDQEGLELIYADDIDEDGNDSWDIVSFDDYKRKGLDKEKLEEKLSDKMLLMIEAFQTLNDQQQYVLRVTFDYDMPGREHQRLPNKISRLLAEALNTTPENIRQIRRRARIKIKEYIDQRSEK
ncbi:MAG: hypothetical protein ACKVRN_12130 [Pyrinomonadaceae bacterium]